MVVPVESILHQRIHSPSNAHAVQSRNCGAITYFTYTENGLQPETQYLFDLELPLDVTPKPQDGEVDCFYLWTLEEVND